jgi:hypothetical protein
MFHGYQVRVNANVCNVWLIFKNSQQKLGEKVQAIHALNAEESKRYDYVPTWRLVGF